MLSGLPSRNASVYQFILVVFENLRSVPHGQDKSCRHANHPGQSVKRTADDSAPAVCASAELCQCTAVAYTGSGAEQENIAQTRSEAGRSRPCPIIRAIRFRIRNGVDPWAISGMTSRTRCACSSRIPASPSPPWPRWRWASEPTPPSFSVVNAVLLKPLTYPDADRMVDFPAHVSGLANSLHSIPEFHFFQRQTKHISKRSWHTTTPAPALTLPATVRSRSTAFTLPRATSACMARPSCWGGPSRRRRTRPTAARWWC